MRRAPPSQAKVMAKIMTNGDGQRSGPKVRTMRRWQHRDGLESRQAGRCASQHHYRQAGAAASSMPAAKATKAQRVSTSVLEPRLESGLHMDGTLGDVQGRLFHRLGQRWMGVARASEVFG